jgi:hypothetical protein
MTTYSWCLKHGRVESSDERCDSNDVLGPYETADEAASALERIAARNEVLDEEDERWEER